MRTPSRIVCLTEETVEILYRLGCEDRIVGVSGFAVRPPGVRSKPRVSTFTDARYDEIRALRPDLVFAFSDVQADMTRELVRQGYNVVTLNQRSVDEILGVIELVGRIVGRPSEAQRLADECLQHVDGVRRSAPEHRPKVYFEEWYDPMITGIRWVSELVEAAGGNDVFEARSHGTAARDRVVTSDEVIAADPDVMLGSWCGKMFKPDQVRARAGWDAVTAVRTHRLYDIPSSLILQPGPAALTDGIDRLAAAIREHGPRV